MTTRHQLYPKRCCYIHTMQHHNTLFLLAYIPQIPAQMVHLRGKLCRPGLNGLESAWIDIRANYTQFEFLQQIINQNGKTIPSWQLTSLEDASTPNF
jgi:hypothetical protein